MVPPKDALVARSRDVWANPIISPPYASTPVYVSGTHGMIEPPRPMIAKENRRGCDYEMGRQELRPGISDGAVSIGGQGVDWGENHLKRLPFTPRGRLAPGLPMEPGCDPAGQSFPERRRAVQRGYGSEQIAGAAIIQKPLIPRGPHLEDLVVALRTSFDTALIVVSHGFALPGRTNETSKSFELIRYRKSRLKGRGRCLAAMHLRPGAGEPPILG